MSSPHLTLNGHALSAEQMLVLGVAFGAAEHLLNKSEKAPLDAEDVQMIAELRQILAELRAMARGQDSDAASCSSQRED